MNWQPPQVVVRAAEPSLTSDAQRLARLAGLTVQKTDAAVESMPEFDKRPWTLLVKPSELSLIRPDGLSIEIDFIGGRGIQRSREASFKSQPLARALGLQKLRSRTNQQPTVIDATAGFGTDGWMMASLGCKVRLLEASPVLASMLIHALNQARSTSMKTTTPAPKQAVKTEPLQNLEVINTDSVQFLNDKENTGANIIYLDPMYPQTRSKALVKKGMQLLHDLIGPDNNGAQLLSAALTRADYRVVVKRPRGAPQLAGSADFAGQISDVQSSNTRYVKP